jgi:hypothetical protein
MSKEFQGGDINAVIRLVKSLSDDGDCQLSILTMALVTACRSCGVPKDKALEVVAETFDLEYQLVPLDDRQFAS